MRIDADYTVAEIRADEERVTALTRHLLSALARYVEETHEIGFLDLVLSLQNFHRVVVSHQARSLRMDKPDTEAYFNMVIATLEASLQREVQRRFTPDKAKTD